MSVTEKYRGREVTDADVAFIQQLIDAHPTLSRRALSQKLCEAWNWVQPNGQPRDMVCRGLMLHLHRAGCIALPPRRTVPRNPLAHRSKPVAIHSASAFANGFPKKLPWKQRCTDVECRPIETTETA